MTGVLRLPNEHGERGQVAQDGTFFCNGCSRRRRAVLRHDSGFCVDCIDAGHRFWLRSSLSWREIVELAEGVWPQDFMRDAA